MCNFHLSMRMRSAHQLVFSRHAHRFILPVLLMGDFNFVEDWRKDRFRARMGEELDEEISPDDGECPQNA